MLSSRGMFNRLQIQTRTHGEAHRGSTQGVRPDAGVAFWNERGTRLRAPCPSCQDRPTSRRRVTSAAAGPYTGEMQRIVGVFALLLCACLTAGCGGSHVRLTAIRAGHLSRPPAWLSRIVAREDRLLGDRNPVGGTSYTLSNRKDVVEMFGEFTTPPPTACTTSYCPSPFGQRGTSLRLVVSPRTHRILSATLSRRITGAQAPAVARRSSRFLRIFPARPGRTACSIPRGGLNPTRATFRGRCTTEFVTYPYIRKTVRVRFGEQWRLGERLQRAAWIVTVRRRDGRVRSTQVTGQPPQLWK